MVDMMDGCLAALTAESSAVSWVASMEATTADWTDACLAVLTAVTKAVRKVAWTEVMWVDLMAASTVVHSVAHLVVN